MTRRRCDGRSATLMWSSTHVRAIAFGREVVMRSATTPDGPSWVTGAPILPAEPTETFGREAVDKGEGSSWVILLLTLAFPFSWWR